MLELYLRGRSMRIIEFFKRLFHREKPIEIKQKKIFKSTKKDETKEGFKSTKKDETNVCRKIYQLFG